MSVDTTNTAAEPAPIRYTEQQVADALNHPRSTVEPQF
jgi:hypothetical protein